VPTFALAYNPRRRYLSALGAPPTAHRLARVASARRASRRRLSMGAAANPNMIPGGRFWWLTPTARPRTLTGLGQEEFDNSDTTVSDAGSVDWAALAQINATSTPIIPQGPVQIPQAPNIAIPPGPGVAPPLPSGTYGSVVAPNTTVTFTPSGGMITNVPAPAGSTAAWFGASSGIAGLSNGTILFGLGGIALLAMLSARRR